MSLSYKKQPGVLPRDSSMPGNIPVLAISLDAKDPVDRFLWAKHNFRAVEYAPDPLYPELIAVHLQPFVAAGMPIRFHCRFREYEIGNSDPVQAAEALRVHLRMLGAIKNFGNTFVTVHCNLNRQIDFNPEIAVENLTRLVAYGRSFGITICLENLRLGNASIPMDVMRWAELSGSMITMDIGHAVSSEVVKSGALSLRDVVNVFYNRICEAHVYGKEEGRHYPIVDFNPLQPAVDRLLKANCYWWTIELDGYEEALATREVVSDYLKEKCSEEADVN